MRTWHSLRWCPSFLFCLWMHPFRHRRHLRHLGQRHLGSGSGSADAGDAGATTAAGKACLDTADAFATAAQRCGGNYDAERQAFINDLANGDCNSVRSATRPSSGRSALPSFATISCSDLKEQRLRARAAPSRSCAQIGSVLDARRARSVVQRVQLVGHGHPRQRRRREGVPRNDRDVRARGRAVRRGLPHDVRRSPRPRSERRLQEREDHSRRSRAPQRRPSFVTSEGLHDTPNGTSGPLVRQTAPKNAPPKLPPLAS